MAVYRRRHRALEATLLGLTGGGKLGEIFSRHTTNPMRRDRAVVFDVSSIDETETDLQAAVLLACWSYGFGAVNVANALADAGLEPRRNYFVVLDELWRALRAGSGMVDRVDALTRLNRQCGVGQVMISHTMTDLLALPAEEDRMKARGFVERSGMVICGGLPASEMPLLTAAIPLSRQEQQMLISLAGPARLGLTRPRRRTPRPREVPDQGRRPPGHPRPGRPDLHRETTPERHRQTLARHPQRPSPEPAGDRLPGEGGRGMSAPNRKGHGLGDGLGSGWPSASSSSFGAALSRRPSRILDGRHSRARRPTPLIWSPDWPRAGCPGRPVHHRRLPLVGLIDCADRRRAGGRAEGSVTSAPGSIRPPATWAAGSLDGLRSPRRAPRPRPNGSA